MLISSVAQLLSITLDWAEPFSSSAADAAAAERHMEWQLSWYADPVSLHCQRGSIFFEQSNVFFGDYPESMKQAVGSRLPSFTVEEKTLLKGKHTVSSSLTSS